jgi:thiamine-monophosphate kinase
LPQAWVDKFLSGLLKLAAQFKVPLGGGDTAESPNGVLADMVVLGSVPAGKGILRSGARAGDRIYVTGALGGAAATLEMLRRKRGGKLRGVDFPAHFYPVPRVAVGRRLREKEIPSAMIDVSDGLSTDLAHICDESGVGAEIQAQAVPRGRAGTGTEVDLQFALHGGDDYELLFTAPQGKRVPRRIASVPVTMIGLVTGWKGLLLMGDGARRELSPAGWQHFSGG